MKDKIPSNPNRIRAPITAQVILCIKDIYTYAALIALAVVGLSHTSQARSQSLGSAGALEQQMELERRRDLEQARQRGSQSNTQSPATKDINAPGAQLSVNADPGPSVKITSIIWSGNEVLSTSELNVFIAAFIKEPLHFNELQSITQAVERFYKKRGYIASVSLPVQEINDATLHIEVLEAKLGKAVITSHLSRLSAAQFNAYALRDLQVGAAVNVDQSDHNLLVLSDVPGVALQWNYTRGAQRGETDIEIIADDAPLLIADSGVDNFGSRATGANRFTSNLSLNSPLHLGDALGLSVIKTQGSQYEHLEFSSPLGEQGLRLTTLLSHLNYAITAPDLSALMPLGSYLTTGLELSYPLARSEGRALTVSESLSNKVFLNTNISGSNNYRIDESSLAINASETPALEHTRTITDSTSSYNASHATLAWIQGRLEPTQNEFNQGLQTSAQSAQTTGNFSKLSYIYSQELGLDSNWSAYFQLQGQEASQNLDTSEKIYLGGMYAVRAYPSAEAAGTRGEIINTELRFHLNDQLRIDALYDWGSISQYKNNSSSGPSPSVPLTALNTYALSGYGAQLSYSPDSRLSLKVVIARRIGSNPNASLEGTDQDGSLTKNRFWLSLNYRY